MVYTISLFQAIFVSDEMNVIASSARYRHQEQNSKSTAVEANGVLFEWPFQRVSPPSAPDTDAVNGQGKGEAKRGDKKSNIIYAGAEY